jgi:hypothetical protein
VILLKTSLTLGICAVLNLVLLIVHRPLDGISIGYGFTVCVLCYGSVVCLASHKILLDRKHKSMLK